MEWVDRKSLKDLDKMNRLCNSLGLSTTEADFVSMNLQYVNLYTS